MTRGESITPIESSYDNVVACIVRDANVFNDGSTVTIRTCLTCCNDFTGIIVNYVVTSFSSEEISSWL